MKPLPIKRITLAVILGLTTTITIAWGCAYSQTEWIAFQKKTPPNQPSISQMRFTDGVSNTNSAIGQSIASLTQNGVQLTVVFPAYEPFHDSDTRSADQKISELEELMKSISNQNWFDESTSQTIRAIPILYLGSAPAYSSSDVPHWISRHVPFDYDSETTIIAAGWPFRALYGAEVFVRPFGQLHTPTETFIIQSPTPFMIGFISWRENFKQRLLPTRIIPTGFALDSLLFTTVYIMIMTTPIFLLRTWRYNQNRCTTCGYNLHNLQSNNCPECGNDICRCKL